MPDPKISLTPPIPQIIQHLYEVDPTGTIFILLITKATTERQIIQRTLSSQ